MELSENKVLVKSASSASLTHIWDAFTVWNQRPHLINRCLTGAVTLYKGVVINMQSFKELHHSILEKISKITTSEEIHEALNGIDSIKNEEDSTPDTVMHDITIHIKKMVPRNSHLKPVLEMAVLDKSHCKATFFSLQQSNNRPILPWFPYSLEFVNKEIRLIVSDTVAESDKSAQWLKMHLFPKIHNWTMCDINQNQESLLLVPLDRYSQLYQELKMKYGHQLVEMWSEVTDPLKYVYEDVAIAAYLLLLWEEQQEKCQLDKKQTFVDLGCGNGLLVHILCSEGYPGIGLDVRKRRIWDQYPPTTKLEVNAITPSDNFLFPEADWIIGNHSDELTPWIPVITARSSYKSSFFLLPCCSFDFNGQKFQRICASNSVYADYLDYVEMISVRCGFVTLKDKLRIPSTKRTCFIGSQRSYAEPQMEEVNQTLMNYIKSRCPNYYNSNVFINSGNWITEFKIRESKEPVRNCTRVSKDIIKVVVDIVASLILKDVKHDGVWSSGTPISMADAVAAIPADTLKHLKSECGGLKTLLKNHHNVFCVSNSLVQMRVPEKRTIPGMSFIHKIRGNRGIPLKTKPCWFYHNHPNGCPLADRECSYQHT